MTGKVEPSPQDDVSHLSSTRRRPGGHPSSVLSGFGPIAYIRIGAATEVLETEILDPELIEPREPLQRVTRCEELTIEISGRLLSSAAAVGLCPQEIRFFHTTWSAAQPSTSSLHDLLRYATIHEGSAAEYVNSIATESLRRYAPSGI